MENCAPPFIEDAIMEELLVFTVSLIAAGLASMSGGGASVLVIPMFLWMGLSLPLATSIQKVNSIFWVIPASYNYLHDQKVNWKFFFLFAGIGLIGIYFGVMTVIHIDQEILKVVIGIIILILVTYTFLNKNLGLQKVEVHKKSVWKRIEYPTALLLGFYEGIFGSGNGMALSVLTMHSRGFDMITALGYYFGIACIWLIFASALFIAKGFVDVPLMIAGSVGSTIGSYAGSKYAKYKGNMFVKVLFLIVGTLLGLKLVLGV